MRRRVQLRPQLEKQLFAYAAAASAAGIGLLTPTAQAKIIYTPVHEQLPINRPFPLNLDHNGSPNLILVNASFETVRFGEQFRYLAACHHVIAISLSSGWGYFCTTASSANAHNKVVVSGENPRDPAAALPCGKKIQAGDLFGGTSQGRGFPVIMGEVEHDSIVTMSTRWTGPWVNGGKGVTDRYLGIKFKISGKFHFGWARFTIKTHGRNFTATLTGYAYETIPGKGIIAGETKDDDPTPSSLGSLALGERPPE
jgi:hypothetical protein